MLRADFCWPIAHGHFLLAESLRQLLVGRAQSPGFLLLAVLVDRREIILLLLQDLLEALVVVDQLLDSLGLVRDSLRLLGYLVVQLSDLLLALLSLGSQLLFFCL